MVCSQSCAIAAAAGGWSDHQESSKSRGPPVGIRYVYEVFSFYFLKCSYVCCRYPSRPITYRRQDGTVRCISAYWRSTHSYTSTRDRTQRYP